MDLRAVSPTYDREMALIQRAIDSFLETGVALIADVDMSSVQDDDWEARRVHWRKIRTYIAHPQSVRSFVSRIAKDLNRPVVFATENGWNKHCIVRAKIKRLKRNIPLVSMFMLCEQYLSTKQIEGVTLNQDRTNWYLQFHGKSGRKMFEEWTELCRADPAYRKALKLPPLEAPLKLAA